MVENKPGAGSVVGALATIRSPHDGYTLMIANSTTLAINSDAAQERCPTIPHDLAPITLIARIPQVLVVNAALPVHSIADLVKLAKSTPGRPELRHAGAGTAQHLDAEMLESVLDIPMTPRALQGHGAGAHRRRRRAYPDDVQRRSRSRCR